MGSNRYKYVTGVLLVAAAGCTTTEPSDGRDDSFTSGGKADTGGIEDGTPDAKDVLAVANTASYTDLHDAVGLADNAAQAIVAVREGDDGVAGTEDDTTFATLAQLDAVPWVGPVAFHKLLDYARRTYDDYANTRETATDVGTIDGDNSNYVQTYPGRLGFDGDQDWLVAHLSPHAGQGDPRPGLEEIEVALQGPTGLHAQLEAIEVAYDNLGHQFVNRLQVAQDASGQDFGLLTLVYGVRSVDLYLHVSAAPHETSASPYQIWLWFHH